MSPPTAVVRVNPIRLARQIPYSKASFSSRRKDQDPEFLVEGPGKPGPRGCPSPICHPFRATSFAVATHWTTESSKLPAVPITVPPTNNTDRVLRACWALWWVPKTEAAMKVCRFLS